MTLFGWIMFSLFLIVTIFFTSQLIKDILWNHKLSLYKKDLGEKTPRSSKLFWVKRSYGSVVAGLFVLTVLFSGAFKIPNMLDDRILVNAKALSGEQELRSLISNRYGLLNRFYTADEFVNVSESLPIAVPSSNDAPERDFIGTNNQVSGVEEADIVKTDGNKIYYASRYQNKVRILNVGYAGVASVENVLDLGNLYTDSIYLTDDYLIIIGYTYDTDPYNYNENLGIAFWRYPSYTGSVTVYDKSTLDTVYELETDSYFHQYRLIGNTLFLISSKSLSDDELRPYFKVNEQGKDEVITYLDYPDMYYFENVPAQSMSVYTGINLDTFEHNSQAFLGYVNKVYADENNIYTTFSYSDYYNFTDTLSTNTTKTQILKFSIDTEHATLNYIAQGVLDGVIDDQYWMDEYNGYFRVVTTDWSYIKNRLYVLKEDRDTDDLKVVGSITEGLGKPNERVYSVDFQGDIGYVVTFQTIDPRYWIDLANPAQPKIMKATEREGVPTYLHIWNESGSQVVALGLTTNLEGRQTGIEISAYDEVNNLTDAYQLLNETDNGGNWAYSYSEALYNPKALMISKEKGIIAFPVSSHISIQNGPYDVYRSYISQYMVFMIDFSAENVEDIISDPIIISHPESRNFFAVERGVYIEEISELGFEVIYTLSNLGMISYNMTTHEVYQTLYF